MQKKRACCLSAEISHTLLVEEAHSSTSSGPARCKVSKLLLDHLSLEHT